MRTTSHPTRIVLRTLVDSGMKKKATRILDSSLLICPGCVFIINRYDQQTVRYDVRQFPRCFLYSYSIHFFVGYEMLIPSSNGDLFIFWIHSNWSVLGDAQKRARDFSIFVAKRRAKKGSQQKGRNHIDFRIPEPNEGWLMGLVTSVRFSSETLVNNEWD